MPHLPQRSTDLQDDSPRETEVSPPPHLTLEAATIRFIFSDAHLSGRQLSCSQSINRFPTDQLRPVALHLECKALWSLAPPSPPRTTALNELLLSMDSRLQSPLQLSFFPVSQGSSSTPVPPQGPSDEDREDGSRWNLWLYHCKLSNFGQVTSLCNKPQFVLL